MGFLLVGTIITLSIFIACYENRLQQSVLDRTDLKSLLMRKKRYVIFPEGSAVTVTCALTKALISAYPTGLNIVGEQSLYYDLPASINQVKGNLHKTTAYMRKVSSSSSSSYSTIQSVNPYLKLQREKLCPHNSWKNHVSSGCSHNPIARIRNQVYRERRTIFDHLRKIAEMHGYNGRDCILQNLCEVRKFLLPQGQSLVHDMMRILFSWKIPDDYQVVDEYFLAGRATFENCTQTFGGDCGFSLLSFLTYKFHGGF